MVKKSVKQCDVVFGWFASWFTLPAVYYAKKYGKKSIIVVGGYDAAYEPKIRYGAFTNLKERLPAKYILKNADILLAVSNFTKNEVLKHVKPKQIEVVYNGVDTCISEPIQKKENTIVTVSPVTEKGIYLKGLKTFAEVSTYFPDYNFVIIGPKEKSITDKLKKINPNLIFTGQIEHEKVFEWLRSAKVYCQLSYIESFGLSVAEAMSYGCIPVVTNRGALSEVVGDIGLYVSYGDEKGTADAIKEALKATDDLRKKARERIKKKFSIETREKKLLKIIENTTKKLK
ncbi:MAG: glycosyl transferase family 1 [Thermoplasmata archaeon]|nr:MAG: glycosyl transferase family 1 [Thermoplasmata archaeon]